MHAVRLIAGGIYACGPAWTQPAPQPMVPWRIYAPISGGAAIVLGGVATALTPGSLYLIPPHPAAQQRCARRMLVHWLHFLPPRTPEPGLRALRAVVTWPVAAYPHAATVLAQAGAAVAGADAVAAQRLVGLALELCGAALAQARASGPPPLPPVVAAGLRALEEAFPHDPGAPALARAAGVSAMHLRRAFRAALGLPPHAWLVQRRLAAAAHALAEGTAPIAAIAAQCGYEDAFYFARLFHHRFGLSPRAYRALRRQPP